MGRWRVHWCAIVRAQESDTLLCHLCELQQRHHLEAGTGVSHRLFFHKVGWVTHPPLSTAVSMLEHVDNKADWASTCEDIVRPRLEFVRAAYRIQRGLARLKASLKTQQLPISSVMYILTDDRYCSDTAGTLRPQAARGSSP